jgi:hypothetical protein
VIEVVSKQTPESTGGVLVLPLVVVAVVLLGASKGMQLSHFCWTESSCRRVSITSVEIHQISSNSCSCLETCAESMDGKSCC